MTRSLKIFSTAVMPFDKLKFSWNLRERRYGAESISQFISRNSHSLEFLEINGSCEQRLYGCPQLKLTTSRYVGCVPIFSPENGVLLGSLTVEGRFGEDISELMSIVGEYVPPVFNEELELKGNFIKPPLYFECQHFIDQYLEARRYKWRKFDNICKIEHQPASSTQWDRYSILSVDPANTFKYPNKSNVLTRDHPEWNQLNYVLDLCITEIMSSSTPVRSKSAYRNKINLLSNSYDKLKIQRVSQIRTHHSDPVVIKSLKKTANNILSNNSQSYHAWRIDFAEFFERYVQYLMKTVAQRKSARLHSNPRYSISGSKPNWALQYLEPDIVLEREGVQYIIDAKYKAHMYNVNGDGEELKQEFRSDFHQVLAYSSMSVASVKHVLLVYPSSVFVHRRLNVHSSLNGCSCTVGLIGISLRKQDLSETIKKLSEIVVF